MIVLGRGVETKLALLLAIASSSALACSMSDYDGHITAIERYAAAMLLLSAGLAVVGLVSAWQQRSAWIGVAVFTLLALHPAWWVSSASGCGMQRADTSLYGTEIMAFLCLRVASHRRRNPWLLAAVVLVILAATTQAVPRLREDWFGLAFFMVRAPALLACWLSITSSILGQRVESARRERTTLSRPHRRALTAALMIGIPITLFALLATAGFAFTCYRERGDVMQELAFGLSGKDLESWQLFIK